MFFTNLMIYHPANKYLFIQIINEFNVVIPCE